MNDQPKKRGRKVGSKNKNTDSNIKEPPKKRGRKPNKKIVTNENPVFADDNLNIEDLIIKLNSEKKDNNLSSEINEDNELDLINNKKLCWNCCHNIDNNTIITAAAEINFFTVLGVFISPIWKLARPYE